MKKNSYSQLDSFKQPVVARGFTLVELVIVMLILSILAATAYARISQTGSQARDWPRCNHLKQRCCR
ncbi:type II secretion system protein [Methylophilus sp. Leaf414]|uniref:type II secretion system protein n=1 Tax=Methylophilus sp. Leaf414 TaxID=1736371 RepID=UPI000AF01FFD|nr:prepilin-type N-terminal cleavage/methylation domain-containing protein [Methylophilus sp. Leaf414]